MKVIENEDKNHDAHDKDNNKSNNNHSQDLNDLPAAS
jgi:hypothetical protein